jgi:hypothetical protein
MLVKLNSAISMFTCGCLVSVASSPANVGFVVTSGQAQVGGAVVQGNSTLFQGDLVQTGEATSDLMFSGGANVLLQPESAVRVYREYAVLQNGIATKRGNNAYALIANGLKVSSLSPQGSVVVGLQDKNHLDVTAQGAPAEIRNAGGVLVARLEAGKALRFAVQAAAPQNSASPALPQTSAPTTPLPAGTQVTLHGILRKDHAGRYGHYLLTDLASKVTYELQGSGLEDLVGGSIEATGSILGTPAAGGAARVLSISDVHQMPLSEITGGTTTAAAPATEAPEAEAPAPSSETAPAPGPEVAATPETKAPAGVNTEPPTPTPVAPHSDTGKILIIVGLAAGVGVGAAVGLAGGSKSTVSPQ